MDYLIKPDIQIAIPKDINLGPLSLGDELLFQSDITEVKKC